MPYKRDISFTGKLARMFWVRSFKVVGALNVESLSLSDSFGFLFKVEVKLVAWFWQVQKYKYGIA